MKRKAVVFCILLSLLVMSSGLNVGATEDRDQTCSAFGLNNQGSLVFGANYDNTIIPGLLFINQRNVAKTGWETGTTGDYAQWVSHYGSVTFNQAGYQLPWAGMNEAGLVLSTMALGETQNPAADERPPLQSSLWMQYQLDNSATIDDVIASDAVVRMSNTVDHYLVCDHTAACAVIEYLDGEMVVHKGDDLPVSALTNNLYDESVAAWQTAREAQSAPADNSLHRFFTAAERVTSFDPAALDGTAVDYAFETLSQVSDFMTEWSIVFDPEHQRAYYRTRQNEDIRYIDLNTFDLSCQTPVQMLNVHFEGLGDISGDFVEYDHDVSYRHLVRFLNQWAPGLYSEEQIQAILGMAESFPCTE
jgi:penicillin V acylase-like amidase (Ntn superfamily)